MAHEPEQVVEPLPHHLLHVKVGFAEFGVAAGEKFVLLALHGAPGARIALPGLADGLGINGIDLAVEIGEFGIAADRLVDRPSSRWHS